MPEFRTFVMRQRPSRLPQALRAGLTLCAVAGATVLGLEAWALFATDAPSFLRALPWLTAGWH